MSWSTSGCGRSTAPPRKPDPRADYSRSGRGRLEHAEADPGPLQAIKQGIPHRHRSGHLAGALRQLIEGETECRLGQHLRGLAVARVAAGDLGDNALAAALADELDLEPAPGAL